jgi:hypothetical protein
VNIPSNNLRARRGKRGIVVGAYSLVMRQTEVLPLPLPVQSSHWMAGLMGNLMLVLSVAAPVQGSPLMFHVGNALCPSLANTAFSAAAARQEPGQK